MPTRDALAVAVLAALLLFVALNLQAGWVYAVDALLIGLLLTGFISTRLAVHNIAVRRQMPREAFEGDRIPVTLTVVGTGWHRFFLVIRDAVPGLGTTHAFIPVLSPGRPASLTYHADVRRRGIHRVDTVEVQSAGLTGLFSIRRSIGAPGTIVAYPRYWSLARFAVPGRSEMEPHVTFQQARSGLEFSGVRDFRDGDSLRHVHWRSTARRGTLVVREFEREMQSAATLLLDTRPEVHAGDEAASTFEDLIRAAASVAHFVTGSGRSVRLMVGRGVQPDITVGGWMDVLDVLARVAADGRLSPMELYAAAELPEQTPMVVLTPDRDAVMALTRRGIPVVAVLADAASYRQHAAVDDGGLPSVRALGVPMCVLRRGEEIATCLESCD